MTPETLLAEAAEADSAADTLWAKIDAARAGSDVLIPAGLEAMAKRAAGFRRSARYLRADAAHITQNTGPVVSPAIIRPALPARPAPLSAVAPSASPLPLEAAAEDPLDLIVARILNSDSAAPETRPVTSAPKASGAAEDTARLIAERILRA